MHLSQRQHFTLALKSLVLAVSLAALLGGSVAAQTSVRSGPRTGAAPETRPGAEGGSKAIARPEAIAKPEADTGAATINTRVYDVRDLLGSVADYPFTGTMAGSEVRRPDPAPSATDPPKPQEASTGGAAMTPANTAPPPRQDPNDQLIRLFMDAIDTDSWRDNGGSKGTIRIMSGRLIVTQTEENQKGVASILGQLRETNAVVVRVRAHWLLLQPGEVDSLYKKPAAGGETGRPQPAYPEIDRDALEKAGGKSGHYRAEIVCFDSQTVHITSGRARRVLSSVTAVVGTEAAAYEPVPETVRSGLVLQFTPVLTADRRAARLDVYSTFADVDAAATTAPPLPLAAEHAVGAGSVVDRYQAQSQELRTTVSVPVGRPILVGGMTLDPTAKGTDSPQLYLVVELTASESRE